MNRVFLFNPENDIALALDMERFTPPRNAELLSHYGAPLLWWLGDADDVVLVPELTAEEEYARKRWLADTTERFGPGPRLVKSFEELTDKTDWQLSPWGWSTNAAWRFLNTEASQLLLPYTTEQLKALRNLSHRRTSIGILQALHTYGWNSELPVEATTWKEITDFAATHTCFFIKSPWSSSGRGVFRSTDIPSSTLQTRCEGIIRNQGSLLIESAFEKTVDFAMLFNKSGSNITHTGYSLFFNQRGASYSGNTIASDQDILLHLSQYVPREQFISLAETLCKVLTKKIDKDYNGPLGIDMLIYKHTSHSGPQHPKFAIAPCIELNLRYTMGFVAHNISKRIKNSQPMQMAILPKQQQLPSTDCIRLVPQNPYFNIILKK